jgi:hypothetical protein
MAIPTELLVKITSRLAPDGGPATAQDALGVWVKLFGKLVPLLGPLSNELLFARSVTTRQPAFPWLPRLEPGAESTAFAGFGPCLDGRSPEEIVAVNRALLETYTAALADLIGAHLATRLLRAAFPDTDS